MFTCPQDIFRFSFLFRSAVKAAQRTKAEKKVQQMAVEITNTNAFQLWNLFYLVTDLNIHEFIFLVH